ncbi:conserved hypothetical protein [Thermosulfidibacter takaii ABI70S6]|uniref:Radical SAM core domain-containing protein n=1 Tax=Thermosulfidibacter takaii (strain DSM 17441 / JCM 13301 / NBRC 103674 / ABI70S6) TaxID=1298851 RepID=A0A0S3QSN7_THET7|nr:TIGR01212 family radical SAM protein [Thermosulfidibacter takaii]BAT71341.1 conserved hypothetical protein [Thermosulfidibacter takaii ABI70S6]
MRERYFSFNRYLRQKYGVRVHRVPVNLGLGCPHRKDRTGEGGCIFCDSYASGVLPSGVPVEEQVQRGIAYAERRYKAKLFMVYFQAYSNTFAPCDVLEELYKGALIDERIVGIIVGTRPDLVPDEVLDLLESFSSKYEMWLELGLQSSHYRTLRFINRGHGVSYFVDAVLRAKERSINVGTHVILGLPGEDREDMIETALFVSALPVDAVKIHNLHVLKNTHLEKLYREGKVKILSMDEYVSMCVDFLEHLRGDIIIQRLTGEAPRDRLVAPLWCLEKAKVLRAIEEELELKDTYQGRRCPFRRP